MPNPQSFKNHRRFIPLYHVFVFAALAANAALAGDRLVRAPSGETAIAALTAVALIVLASYARSFALRVQDRVIRLEMRLRMQQVLPAELRGRIPEFTPRQLIAMRFASDAELPELAAAVLRDNLQDGQAIKKMIKTWQADYLRA